MITKNDIKKLDSFKTLNSVQKLLSLKYFNLKKIDHAVTVIKNIGFDQWLKISNETKSNITLIKELTNGR